MNEKPQRCLACGHMNLTSNDFRYENRVDVDAAYLEKLLTAEREALPPRPDCVCVVAKGNNCFTNDFLYFNACGHWFNWKETPVWFRDRGGDGELCPGCLIEHVRAGRVILDPDGLREAIKAVKRFYEPESAENESF